MNVLIGIRATNPPSTSHQKENPTLVSISSRYGETVVRMRKKLKEIRSLVREQVEIIKDMQVNCQALHLASHGYEQ